MKQDIRWEQRFDNYNKAFSLLEEGVQIENPNKLEREGIIQRFEYTFYLAWKTLKDFLEYQGYQDITGSRDTFRQAFKIGIISEGAVWMQMIESRNLTSHTYDEETANEILSSIEKEYISLFRSLMKQLQKEKAQN